MSLTIYELHIVGPHERMNYKLLSRTSRVDLAIGRQPNEGLMNYYIKLTFSGDIFGHLQLYR